MGNNMVIKSKKTIIISVLVLLAAVVCAVGAGPLMRYIKADEIKYEEARHLLNTGDFESARVKFEELSEIGYADSADMIVECDYTEAVTLFEGGEHEKAKLAFEELEGYKESAFFIRECEYYAVLDAFEAGDWFAAWEGFEVFSDHEGSEEKIEQCIDNIYNEALQDMIHSEFETAQAKFEKLGDYKLSKIQLANCVERIEAEAAFEKNELLIPYRKVQHFDEGSIYIDPLGYYYVPDEVTEETAWLVYFPGGGGTGRNLSIESVWLEHTMFNPDAVMIWLWDNGFWDVPGFVGGKLWDMMKQIALECDIWIHDFATVGSSNGCYPAMMAAAEFYRQVGITVDNVLAFDPGLEWDGVMEIVMLDDEQCELLAESGSTVYLLEQHDFTEYFTTKEPIVEMLEYGADIIIVECKNDGHNHIGPDAIRAGAFQYVINQQDAFDSDGFTFWKVYADGSKEPFTRESVTK